MKKERVLIIVGVLVVVAVYCIYSLPYWLTNLAVKKSGVRDYNFALNKLAVQTSFTKAQKEYTLSEIASNYRSVRDFKSELYYLQELRKIVPDNRGYIELEYVANIHLKDFDAAAKIARDDLRRNNLLVQTYISKRDLQNARAALQKYKSERRHELADYYEAEIEYLAGNYPKAKALIDANLQKAYDHRKSWELKANIAKSTKDEATYKMCQEKLKNMGR